MNTCKRWAAVLIAIVLLPNVAASADAAKEAYQKGMAFLDKKDYGDAITAFTEAIRLDPKNAEAYGNRSRAYANRGDFEKAFSDCNKAIHLNPKSALAYRRSDQQPTHVRAAGKTGKIGASGRGTCQTG